MQNIIEIAEIQLYLTNYIEILQHIEKSLLNNNKLLIGYANAHSVNISYNNKNLKNYLSEFDIVHPDGIGIYLAVKFLNKNLKNLIRFNGSDLYPMLAELCINKNYKLFFFGETKQILSLIQKNYPQLKVAGTAEGYNFKDEEVIERINKTECDILVIGLGTPLQEEFTYKYHNQINCKCIICVGEGIKVFAGVKKRGPKIIRKLGFEWLVRLLNNPLRYFTRYIIGNPLFLYRIIILKFRNFNK